MALSFINWHIATRKLNESDDLAPWQEILSEADIAPFAEAMTEDLMELESRFREFTTPHSLVLDRHRSAFHRS